MYKFRNKSKFYEMTFRNQLEMFQVVIRKEWSTITLKDIKAEYAKLKICILQKSMKSYQNILHHLIFELLSQFKIWDMLIHQKHVNLHKKLE